MAAGSWNNLDVCMDEGSDSFLSPPPDFYLEQPVLRANSPGCGAISVFETVRGGESKAVNNESERGRDGHLESFKADPYEMFEQVARPLSGCRFTYRNGGGDRNGYNAWNILSSLFSSNRRSCFCSEEKLIRSKLRI